MELARKSARKWQRTLKFKGLYGLSSHVKTKKASLLLRKGCFFIIITVIDTAKIRDYKKIRHLFNIIPHFFLRNQNIRRIFAERICRKVDGSQKAILKT
ncbi:hypothetical protein [Segatella copri]|uniref:hypothetical protein n=1 Tax=Segatella copri TaxID=165179 RepID=UPI0025D11DE7|nr:hypothetical protein [Segatella copri]